MTRSEKVHKLRNAVLEWRGAYDESRGKWVRAPKPAAIDRVMKWLIRLGLSVEKSLDELRKLPSRDAFDQWLRRL